MKMYEWRNLIQSMDWVIHFFGSGKTFTAEYWRRRETISRAYQEESLKNPREIRDDCKMPYKKVNVLSLEMKKWFAENYKFPKQ